MWPEGHCLNTTGIADWYMISHTLQQWSRCGSNNEWYKTSKLLLSKLPYNYALYNKYETLLNLEDRYVIGDRCLWWEYDSMYSTELQFVSMYPHWLVRAHRHGVTLVTPVYLGIKLINDRDLELNTGSYSSLQTTLTTVS